MVPLAIISFFYKWFGSAIPLYTDTANNSSSVSLCAHFVGALVEGISVGLLLWGGICFIKTLRYYQKGELFSANTLALFHKMSRIAFAWTFYEPIKITLLSFITTSANPVGQRVITIEFTSHDIIHIFIVGCFLIITSLIHEAYTLKNEHDLTV